MDHQAFAQLLGNYGEFVGAIAVVATLLYLARQIKHNSQQVRGASTIAVHEFQRNLVEHVLHQPELLALVTKGNLDWNSLSHEEQAKYALWNLKEAGFHEMCFQLWKQGALEESVYKSRIDYFVPLFSTPGRRTWWDEQASSFMLDPLFYQEMTVKLNEYQGEDFATKFPQFDGSTSSGD